MPQYSCQAELLLIINKRCQQVSSFIKIKLKTLENDVALCYSLCQNAQQHRACQ